MVNIMETKRKLASVQKIFNIKDIPKADKLQVANVLGWQVVIEKGSYQENDDVLYLEIDSFIPETRNEFEFLRARCFKEYPDGRKGFRIKTIRLRGQISQGLVMPLSILPRAKYTIGQDVTQLLGVCKWEPPMPKCLSGKAKGYYPSWLIKTDETRVQVLQPVITRHKGTKCYITEKIDGSSFTAYLKDDIFGVCSRGVDFKVDDEDNRKSNAYVKWAIENNIEKKMRDYLTWSFGTITGKNFAIQGEIAGKDIRGNSLGLDGKDVWFFNVFLIDECRYLDCIEFHSVIESMGLKTVPIITDNFTLIDNIEELVKLSTGKSIINPKVWREGIVIRPLVEMLDLQMSAYNFTTARLSFKVVNPEYLIESES
jgi:RNA ligase (TIGR02306 family)